ncbi:hypothetical protein P3H15_32675 [Rhodococcus sp. T2V]|uniref:hypothetical protein n=1 Tax=Rhodococcus sp. T2V TaxID=3034164 RepID=UPI0023E2D874|nr:hypothetical protein [Rhodococcus sp. T2V]MDF3309775.1 hypothetical protein [Rhodococcus sp. T2V]
MSTEPIDLDAAQALADAATPGPWVTTPPDMISSELFRYWSIGTEVDGLLERFTGDIGGNLTNTQADAEFIAQARTLVPALIAEVRKEREHRRALQRECERTESENRHLANNLDVQRAGRAAAESAVARVKKVLKLADDANRTRVTVDLIAIAVKGLD